MIISERISFHAYLLYNLFPYNLIFLFFSNYGIKKYSLINKIYMITILKNIEKIKSSKLWLNCKKKRKTQSNIVIAEQSIPKLN